jgi:biopolymer transport protein ExbD
MASAGGDDGESLKLNIMPMLDVFSILIVFLLMSYSTDPVSYDISAGLELPDSQTLIALDSLPTIVVTKNEILVQDKKVASIFGGDVEEKDRSQGAIFPVFKALEQIAEANKRTKAKSTEQKKALSTLTMEMDKAHRFQLMKRIMLAAQQAEFITFNLMVGRQEG